MKHYYYFLIRRLYRKNGMDIEQALPEWRSFGKRELKQVYNYLKIQFDIRKGK